MVTLEGFKDFAKIYRPGEMATPSFGILTLTRASQTPPLQPIEVAEGTDFFAANRAFKAIERTIISESARFAPCGVQSSMGGAAANIAAGQTWTSGISGITIANAAAFSGGKDAIPAKGDPIDGLAPEGDADLQSHLDVAKAMILKKLGGPEALPDAPSVDRAVYLYAQWTRQQRHFSERRRSIGNERDDYNITETNYFRQAGTQDALNREIDNLLSGYGDPTAFMP